MATSVLPKPTSPHTRRSIGIGASMSAFTSTIALSWSGVSRYGKASSSSRCQTVSSGNAWPGRVQPLLVEHDQLLRDVLHLGADPGLGLLPVGAAELRQARRVAAGVVADGVDLVGRDVELVVAPVLEQEVVALDAADGAGDHAAVAGDAVLVVHDVVAGLEVVEERGGVGAAGPRARGGRGAGR